MSNIDLIKELVEQTQRLQYGDQAAQQKLILRAEMILRNVFGDTNRYLEDLDRIFSAPRLWSQTSQTSEREERRFWDDRKQRAESFFQTILEEVTLFKNDVQDTHDREENQALKDKSRVAVVHGRDEQARDNMFRFLRAIQLNPIEWSDAVKHTGSGSPYVGDVLDALFDNAHAVVVLMTPDDEARLRESLRKSDDPDYEISLTPQPRPNVLFEAGMALARFPKHTIIVELGSLRPFSDIYGRHVVKLDNSEERLRELVKRLGTAGCPTNTTGTKWLREGNFDNKPFVIVDATWGAGSSPADVLEILEKEIKNDKLSTTASKRVLGDPARGDRKTLSIHYIANGKSYKRNFDENQAVDLP